MLRFAILDRLEFADIGVDEPIGLRNDYLLLHVIADAHPMNPIEVLADRLRLKPNIWRYLRELHGDTRATLNDIYAHCVNFPFGGTAVDFRRYIGRCTIGTYYTFRDTRATVTMITRALNAQRALRDLAVFSQESRAEGDQTAEDYRNLRNSYVNTLSDFQLEPRVPVLPDVVR